MFRHSIIFLSLLLLSVHAAPVSGQIAYVKLTNFAYSGAPIRIAMPEIRLEKGKGFRIYSDCENLCETDITGIHFWILLYFEGQKEPELFEYTSAEIIKAKTVLNFYWDEPQNKSGDPVAGLIAPYLCELSDDTYWSLREFYELENMNFPLLGSPLVYPQIGYVTAMSDSIGVIKTMLNQNLRIGQRLGLVRKSGSSTIKVAQIRILNGSTSRYGFKALYRYPDEHITATDRVQLVFPGASRLNSTAKSLFLMSSISAASAGVFQYIKKKSEDRLVNAESASYYYRTKIERNRHRRNTALVSAGITAGSAILSELIWGRHGEHLFPREQSKLRKKDWNTTTKSFMSASLLSLGSAAFFGNKDEWAGYKKDAALIAAGSAFGAGLLNQAILGNKWPYYETGGSRLSPANWNPVSRGFVLMGLNAGATGLVFQYMRLRAGDKAADATVYVNLVKFNRDVKRYKKRRDSAYIVGGSAFLAGMLHETFFKPAPDDIFRGKTYFKFPALRGPSKYFAGLAAISSGVSAYFNIKVNDYEDKLADTADEEQRADLRKKIDDNREYRNFMLVTTGISAGTSLLTYIALRNRTGNQPYSIGRNIYPGGSRITITPGYNPLQNSFGLSIRF